MVEPIDEGVLADRLARWETYLRRRRMLEALDAARAAGDRRRARRLERELEESAEVSSLEALAVNAELVEILTVQRLIAMRAAREEGATLAQVGQALGVSRQSVWEFMQRKIEARRAAGKLGTQPPGRDGA